MLLFSKVVYTVEENDHHSSLIGGHSQLDISEECQNSIQSMQVQQNTSTHIPNTTGLSLFL